MSVHWDRLDVKVAVRYPKSYGPRGGKGKGRGSLEEEKNDDADKVHSRDLMPRFVLSLLLLSVPSQILLRGLPCHPCWFDGL